jgi:hypothetical protein
MIYQTELCNLKDPENAKFFSDLAYNCFLTNGKKGTDPIINYGYFKYHGTKEESENAKRELERFEDIWEKNIHELEELIKTVPDNIKRVRQDFLFNGQIYFVEMSRQ